MYVNNSRLVMIKYYAYVMNYIMNYYLSWMHNGWINYDEKWGEPRLIIILMN